MAWIAQTIVELPPPERRQSHRPREVGRRPHHVMREALLTALESTEIPIDAFECARIAGRPVNRIKEALSIALKGNLIHVARTQSCLGGCRYFYLSGPKPENVVEPIHETLRAMLLAKDDEP